jgi:hypothetical protein
MFMICEYTLLVLMALCHPVFGGLSGKLRICCEDVVVICSYSSFVCVYLRFLMFCGRLAGHVICSSFGL